METNQHLRERLIEAADQQPGEIRELLLEAAAKIGAIGECQRVRPYTPLYLLQEAGGTNLVCSHTPEHRTELGTPQ